MLGVPNSFPSISTEVSYHTHFRFLMSIEDRYIPAGQSIL